MTTREPTRLIDVHAVRRLVGAPSNAAVYRLRAYCPSFPNPLKMGRRLKWVESEIEAFVQSRIAERNRLEGRNR